jgi:hypothetical protein
MSMERPTRPRAAAPTARHLTLLVALAAAVHGVVAGHAEVAARDSVGFARFALQLDGTVAVTRPLPPHAAPLINALPPGPTRHTLAAVATNEHPPGYALAVWAVSVPVRAATDLPLPDALALSCRIASAIAGVLLVVPLYFLGRSLFGPTSGLIGASVFQLLPVAAQVTSDGLTEATYLLAVAVTLTVGVRALRRPTAGGLALCGLGSAAAYLVRPEGVLVGFAVGVLLLVRAALRASERPTAGRGAVALAGGFAVLAGPYMLLIGGVTNKPTGRDIANPLEPAKSAVSDARTAGPPLASLFAAYMKEEGRDAPKSRALWAARELFQEWFKTSHYAAALLGAWGVWLVRRRVPGSPGVALLILFGGLNAGLLWFVGVKSGYVSERHTLPLAMLACVFAGAAVPALARRLAALVPRAGLPAGTWAGVITFGLLASGLPVTLRTMHENRGGHRAVGLWLAEHAGKGDIIVDPWCWASYYSGTVFREGQPLPPARAHYVVLERGGSGHPRLPLLPLAEKIAAEGAVVYEVPRGKAKVIVVRVPPEEK